MLRLDAVVRPTPAESVVRLRAVLKTSQAPAEGVVIWSGKGSGRELEADKTFPWEPKEKKKTLDNNIQKNKNSNKLHILILTTFCCLFLVSMAETCRSELKKHSRFASA